ncbi:MAG TPA: thioredoxin domain-containing protein [Myxococcota bacterium]|nr:thioredoxin domain-containing protein [Myxococcota bacterium]
MPNRLAGETSPYLLQHADNPVDWFPWGPDALARAKLLDRPIFLSIGYAACHWCHVMERESFEDEATAAILNEHFVAIKVDREARPDVDAIYLAALSAMGQSGGWPLNVWVTPEREPFFGGTYFPPQSVAGRPGFLDVLRRIHEAYTNDRARVTQLSKQIAGAIQQELAGQLAQQSRVPDRSVFDRATSQAAGAADREWGGARGDTKFPTSLPLRALLRHHRQARDPEALALVVTALEKMAAGGIHDQIGGGFHRYSTDARWLVPHFEKMLYDNAVLAVIYLEAAQLTGRADFAAVARSILDYVAREMTSSEGAFYSATDADSRNPHGELEEGWFFTWTPAEIESVLPPELARVAIAYYGVTPQGDIEGRSILRAWRGADSVAAQLGMKRAAFDEALAKARAALYEARSRRPPPLRDSKVLVAWNALMVSAYARAGLALAEQRYVSAAARAADFILVEMVRDGELARIYQGGRTDGPAFLEDYAFLIAALLDVYEVDSQPRWLRAAVELQSVLDARYADELGGGYFQTAGDVGLLLAREKPSQDGPIPSGNSVAALNLLRLEELTGNHDYGAAATQIFSAFSDRMDDRPGTLAEMLLALDFYLSTRVEIVFIAPPDRTGLDAMLAPVRKAFFPNRVLVAAVADAQLASHAEINPLVRDRIARDGTATAYLCQNYVCGFPTADPAVFAEQFAALTGAAK